MHAEVAAILNAARRGIPTTDSILVCPWAACSNCAKHIADAGVSVLVRHAWEDQTTGSHWKDDCDIGDDIMREAGVKIVEMRPVHYDIQIRRNGELWTP